MRNVSRAIEFIVKGGFIRGLHGRRNMPAGRMKMTYIAFKLTSIVS
jgi:hypothetical protein